MSGGSYNYAYLRVEDFEDELTESKESPQRMIFAKLLVLVAKAMHDIEWVDSCDYASGDENEAIDAVFAFLRGEK